MANGFKKLMREQVQESINDFLVLVEKPIPKKGWIRTMREALGMTSSALAKRLGCTRANITTVEQREQKGTITLQTLEEVANALNCKVVYCLVSVEPLEKILEKQARIVAQKRIAIINHSMKLEQQGLTLKQLQKQEDDLVQELLHGNPKALWKTE